MARAGTNRNSSDSDRARLRECDAVEMRRQGRTYQQIADALGVSRRTAWRRVQAALAERARETVGDRDALIGEQLAYIESVLDGHLPKAVRGDARSAEVVLRALERHARLLGLDAPVRHDVQVTDEMTARIKALADEIAEAAGAAS
jgi:DNA-binding Lrp family transcriptional regulator